MMKMKLLVLCALTSFASTTLFANTLTNDKLIAHKAWGSANIKLTFKEKPVNQMMLNLFKKNSMKYDQFVQTNDKITEVAFDTNSSVWASEDNSHFLSNDTSKTQTYEMTHRACIGKIDADQTPQPKQCSYSSDTIMLEPGKIEFKGSEATMEAYNLAPGKYVVDFVTIVQNDNNDIMYSGFDYQMFTVPASK